MSAPLRGPTVPELQEYMTAGLTQLEMVWKHYQKTGERVSRSAISMALMRSGLSKQAYLRHGELLPWKIAPQHRHATEARYLRLESRRRRGEALPAKTLRRLESWLNQLDAADAVIYYHPGTRQGFWWVPREASDTDIISRRTRPDEPDEVRST